MSHILQVTYKGGKPLAAYHSLGHNGKRAVDRATDAAAMTNHKGADACPFCDLAPDRVTRASTHARALADAYPVTDGHTLVVPIRH